MKNIFPALFLLFIFLSPAYSDTLHLKNGHNIEGIVKSDNGKTIELEVGVDSSVSFLKSEIEGISRGSEQDSLALRQAWEKHKLKIDERMAKALLEEEGKPNSVKFSRDLQGMVVNVLLNNKVEAKMILDTGSSMVIITKNIADKLNIDPAKIEPALKAQLADGRQVSAKRIILASIQVQGAEAKNVEAAILLDDSGNSGFGDGLLGMSFLKRFNFKVDQKEKKLILEKL